MKHFTSFQSYLSEMHREWIGNASGLTRPSRGNLIRYAAMITLLLTLVCGNVWGETQTLTSNNTSGAEGYTAGNDTKVWTKSPVTFSLKNVGGGSSNRKVYGSTQESTFQMSSDASTTPDDKYVEIKVASGYKITNVAIRCTANGTTAGRGIAFCFAGDFSTDNNSVLDTVSFPVISNGGSSSTAPNKNFNTPEGTRTVRIYKRARYDATNKKMVSSGGSQIFSNVSYNIASITVTYTTTSSGRAYDGTEKMFFLRDSWSWWNDGGAKFYAYFWNSSTSASAWSAEATSITTTDDSKTVYGYTVPEGTWDKVIITRGSGASFSDGKTWNQSNDITLEATTNLLTDWTVSGETGHTITWSNITLDGKTVYFDNRNYSTWTTAYVRIGHSSNNSKWDMTKVGGTKYLYSAETDQWDYHTIFSVANNTGWTGSNNAYQPWENQWTGTGNDYQMDKQTTYQKFGIARDVYLCPTSTSTLERDCQYYNVNGGTSTNTFEDVSTGVVLPQYTVTASGTNCTVGLVQYTADDFSTSSALSSGGSVDPTRYVGVTVTPSSGYEFGSVSLTADAYEQHTATAAGVIGKYAILADCEIAASCTPCTYTITYKDGGNTDFTGVHIGSQPTSHTYGTATTLKKASKSGYVFGGWFDNSSCTGDALTTIGATAKTADFTLYAKWTELSLVDLESGTLYTASNMVPAGVSLTSSYQYYPGVSADQRFNVIGTGTTSSDKGPMGAKKNTVTYGGTEFKEVMNFDKTASPTDAVPAHHALQFKIPAAGQLEIWVNNNSNIFLSNGTTEYAVNAQYKILTVTAGTWYLYAKAGSKLLGGIRYKKTHSVSAVTSTGDDTKGTVSASPTVVAEDSASTITAVPAAGYRVTNWAVSGTGATISPSGSSSSTTTTLTMGTADATVTVTFGDASYGVTHTLTNASKTSGATTATHGTNYTVVFAAADGYSLPNSITVTIGGDEVTEDTEYTWDKSTGTVVVDGDYITGAIVITVTGTVACSAPSAPSISGTQIYAVGDDIELTATCASGADGSTTYTWYKGADWATASAADPVQAAATGSSGYTLTIEDCTTDDIDLYWCEASNGVGCTSHNTTGYSVDVPLGVHTITWTLKTGENKSYVHTQSKVSTSSCLTLAAVDTLKNAGPLSIGTGAKSGLTEKIGAPASKDDNKYMYVTFTVADGYQFTPDSAWCIVQAVGTDKNQNGNLVLIDNSGHSMDNNASPVNCPGTKDGTPTKVKITNGGSTSFVGSVTLKIYVYGSAASYRLGETINIKGTVSAFSGYTVTYAGNGNTGGSVPVDANSPYDPGDEVTVLGNTGSLVKTSSTFRGWTDGTTFFLPGQKFEITSDVTLTAVWDGDYNVSFADMSGFDGSSTLPGTITGVPSGKKIVQPADPTAEHYIFVGWYKEAACTNAWNFASDVVSAATTLYAKWSAMHTVTWVVNGSEYTTGDPTTETEGSITTLPTAPADNTLSCADSFRGWSTTNLYGESGQAAPASLFVTAADAPSITKDTVFYAVFGDAASASATSFTTTFTSKSWADADSKWNSGKDGSNLTSGRGIQVSTTTTGANATTKAEYKAVTSVVVTYSTNSSSGAGSIEIKVGGTEMSGSAAVTKEGGESDRTITYTPVYPATSLDGKVQIIVNCTTNSIYIKSVQISHSGTFENYRCLCPTMTVTPELVTASTPIFITSAASSLLIVGSGLSKSTALTLSTTNGSFALKSRTNGVISTDATGSIDTVAYIYYTPGAGDTSDGLDKNANFTVSVAGNGEKDVIVSQALIGRHVPANFVIAAKGLDEKWYLLPANNAKGKPAPIEINVTNDSVLIPEEHVYSLYGQTNTVINGGNGQYVKLAMHGITDGNSPAGPAPLFGGKGDNELGKSGTGKVTSDLSAPNWWYFKQINTSITNADDAKYNLHTANTANPVTLYNNATQWGLYASGAKNVQDIRLFNWIPNYKVFFADGNLTPASHTAWPETVDSVLVGAKISAPTTPTASGYTFIGWYKDAACTSAWNFASDIVTKDTTLYAKWTGSEYNITYHLNGASWVSAGEATYTSGVGYTLPVAGDMSNPGYTFGGWYDNSGLTGSSVTEITTSDYGNKTFWAKWTENTYTITYNANGGSGSTSSTVGHYVTVADNDFTAPDGKTFIEWNTLSTGLGSGYNEGDEIELTANMTLYAIWGKSVGTINWTVTKIDSKLYRGGGGYTIKAEIDDASWDSAPADSSKLVLTASEGVVLRNIAKSINASGKAQITAKFDITTDVNANATKITFTLTVPENNGYAPLADDHDENLDNCTGGKVEVRFLSSNKNDAGDNFADMSTKSNTTQYVGDGLAKLIAIGTANLKDADNKIGYRDDGRLNVVFKFTSATTLDIYFNANATSKSFALYSFSSAKTLSEITTSDYSSKTIVSSGVTAAGATFSSKSHTASTGSASVSSGVVSIGSTKGGLKATYSSLSAGYYVFDAASSSNEGYLFGFDADAGGGGGGAVSPTLTWTPALEDDADWVTDHLAKETGDADFTFTATQNKNSLGAITYASSNTSVATVNATTGKVHIVGAGNATITATMAESGCYEEATASYDITVTDNCDDVAGTVTKEFIDCLTGYRLTVSGHTAATGVTYQWYKDDVSLSPAGQAATYETKTAGEYYVVVTNTGAGHCAKASTNTVTVESMAVPTATKLLDSVFVKNGRRTPDIALVQTEGADNFQVKSGETEIWNTQTSVTTGFAGCSFYLGTNGIIYLMGQKPDGSEPSGLTAGNETLTFIASSCGGSASGVNIEIHKQAATTYKEVAFVVDGTKNGAWDAVTSGHADGTMLYEYLDSVTVYNESTGERDRLFKLYERNIYKTTNEKTLREHYSQFDAILITDDPNTRTVPSKGDDYKTKGYVNAMGALIDVRPILTMEAYVSALANWKAKGIDGNPSSPNPRQYAMKLDCKNHAIFVGIDPESSNVKVEDIDGVEYWTVAMVDSTKSPYSGWAYNSKTDSLPALQGFSASDVSSLMLLGEISGGTLYAGVERQEEAAARLLLLGLNNKALPNALTPEGKKIIENTLKYLIETDMEKVDDCSNYFIGGTEDHETDWNIATNWSKGIVPNSPYVKARILKPCVLSGVTTKVSRVDIATSGKSMHLPSGECSGSLTIEPTGALIVAGAVRSAIAPYFNTGDLMPTEEDDLVLNTNSSNQAALIFNNDKGDTKATVNLYSLGRKVSDAYQFQYMAIPMEHVAVNPAFAGSGIYTYVWQENGGWERRGYYTDLYAFEGVGITTKFAAARDYQMKGTLTSTKSKDIALTKEDAGENIIGNSWTAPLNIASMTTGMRDDDNIEKTVYIYITGNDKADGEDGAQDCWYLACGACYRLDSVLPPWAVLQALPQQSG